MWRLTESERIILRKIVPIELMKQPVSGGKRTIQEIIKVAQKIIGLSKINLQENSLSASDVRTIYNALPSETEFHALVDALRPISSAERSKMAEERLTEEQKENKRNYYNKLEELRQRQVNL